MCIGGYQVPWLQYKAIVEQYDGSSWSEISDLNEHDKVLVLVERIQIQ